MSSPFTKLGRVAVDQANQYNNHLRRQAARLNVARLERYHLTDVQVSGAYNTTTGEFQFVAQLRTFKSSPQNTPEAALADLCQQVKAAVTREVRRAAS